MTDHVNDTLVLASEARRRAKDAKISEDYLIALKPPGDEAEPLSVFLNKVADALTIRAATMPSEDEVVKAVDLVLARGKWPIYQTQDDNGLEWSEYVEFVRDVLREIIPKSPDSDGGGR